MSWDHCLDKIGLQDTRSGDLVWKQQHANLIRVTHLESRSQGAENVAVDCSINDNRLTSLLRLEARWPRAWQRVLALSGMEAAGIALVAEG